MRRIRESLSHQLDLKAASLEPFSSDYLFQQNNKINIKKEREIQVKLRECDIRRSTDLHWRSQSVVVVVAGLPKQRCE